MTTRRKTPEEKAANLARRRREQKPTEKQRLFAELVATGESRTLVDAYTKVYGGRSTPKGRRAEASRVWHHPLVQTMAREVRARVSAQRALRLTGDADAIRRKLWKEADEADRAADRIAALKLLGQQRGVNLFTDRLEIAEPDSVSDAEVLLEIEQILRVASEAPEIVEIAEIVEEGPSPDENIH